MLRPETFAFTLLLAFLTTVGPFSTDMYLPSMPDIARAFGTTSTHVQLTLSSYLIGFACGQIVYGPFSDRHGRKPVLLVALTLYGVSSLACALSPSVDALIVARFFQAFGGTGAVVLARAVVRDLHSGARAARELAVMGMAMSLAPVVAPVAGGLLQTYFGWRAAFVVLVGFAIAALIIVQLLLPETLKHRAPDPVSFRRILRVFGTIARNRVFLAYLGILTACYAGLFAWISACSFVLQELYHLSAFEFSIAFAVGCVGFLIGNWIAAPLVTRIGIDRTLGIGALALAAGGFAMMASIALGLTSGFSLSIPMGLYLAGLGLTLPQAMAGALTPFPDRAGAASSLMGFVQQTLAAGVGAIVVAMIDRTAWPMAIALAVSGCITFAVWASTRAFRRREAAKV